MKRLAAILILFSMGYTANAQITREQQASLTPEAVLQGLMEGNARFVEARARSENPVKRVALTAEGQYPKAVILSCLDSRIPVELIFDQSIGDIFVGRVAGNVPDNDQIGSMEFATKLAGARLVMVLGHSSCGAVRGACADVTLGNLTGLLDKIKPAIALVDGFTPEESTPTNDRFVDAVARANVRQGKTTIRERSEVLTGLEEEGAIMIVGAYYDLRSGRVTLLEN